MNTNMVDEFLSRENERCHENAYCVDVSVGVKAEGGKWVKKGEPMNERDIGYPVYMKGDDVLLYPMSHTLCFGSTGTGKSTVLNDNLIEHFSTLPKDRRPPMCIFDVKGDLTPRHIRHMERAGYRCKVFNCQHPMESDGYNPLAVVYDRYHKAHQLQKMLKEGQIGSTFEGKKYKSVNKAREKAKVERLQLMDFVDNRIIELVEIFLPSNDPKNHSWVEGARNCARAILYTMLKDSLLPYSGMTREKYTIENMCRSAFYTKEDCKPLIKWLRRAEEVSAVGSALGSCYDISAKITRDGYVSSLNSPLAHLASLSVSALTAKNDVDVQRITEGEEDYALFIVPDERNPYTSAITIMMLNDLLLTLVEKADASEKKSLDKDFVILADELANFPAIPHLDRKISTFRSRRLWMHITVQSLEQLHQTYNADVTATILNNCDIQTFLGSNSVQSKRYFSEQMGQTMAKKNMASFGNDGLAAINKSTESVPLVRVSDFSRLKLGEFYVYARQGDYLKSYMTPYFLRADVAHECHEVELKYNGYVPEDNVYRFADVLQYEEEHTLEDADEPEFFKDPDTVYYISPFDRVPPTHSFFTAAAGNTRNIAKGLLGEIGLHPELIGEEDDRRRLLQDVVIFPKEITEIMLDNLYEEYTPEDSTPGWCDYLKREVFYDKSLLQPLGRDHVTCELAARIATAEELGLFGEEVLSALREVKDYVANMDDEEYCKYCVKSLRSSHPHRSVFDD